MLGEAPALMYVLKQKLNIDSRYQRNKISEKKVLEIATKWDWVLLGTLRVAMRDDGSLWVIDGGHRARAAFKRADINELPCAIYHESTIKREAAAFVGVAKNRCQIDSFTRYKASCVAENDISLAVKQILEKYNREVGKAGRPGRTFAAVYTFEKMVKDDKGLADRVFGLLEEACDAGEQPTAASLRGLFRLQKRFLSSIDLLSGKYREKLIDAGIKGIGAVIQRKKIEAGVGGEIIEAKAILEFLNKGLSLKNKLEW